MVAIFSDHVETIMKIFVDDFSVFGSSYDDCLYNLEKILQRCEGTNLILNLKKYYFIVREGIMLVTNFFLKELRWIELKLN